MKATKIVTWFNDLYDADLADVLQLCRDVQGKHFRLISLPADFPLSGEAVIVIWDGEAEASDAELLNTLRLCMAN